MGFFQILGITAAAIWVYMTILWLISLAQKDASIVDIFWGLGFVLAAVFYFDLTVGFLGRKILLMALVIVWGLRLSIYILIRNWGRGEDPRYQKWRAEAGKNYWWISYFRVFMIQGFLMWVISTPLLAAQYYVNPNHFTALDIAGGALWAIGIFFEAVGDWQLARFKANPENKGKVLDTGLWRYTRHPNYFGEATLWWGYFLIALAAGGWWSFYSPILMTFLLLRVSGVALLEKSLKDTKPQYREYVESTSAFFPLPPRKPRQEES